MIDVTRLRWATHEVVNSVDLNGLGQLLIDPGSVGRLERGNPRQALRKFVRAVDIHDAVFGETQKSTLGPLLGAARAAWALEDPQGAIRAGGQLNDRYDSLLLRFFETKAALEATSR